MRWAAPRQAAQGRIAPAEQDLAGRAGRGDRDAFAELVRENQDRIYRLALRMVGPDEAEDVAQQAFVKAWIGLDRFDGGSTFATWLYRIAVNQCLDHLRRARRRPLPLDAVHASAGDGADPADAVAESSERRERAAALAWALARLSGQERLLLHLRLDEAKSYDEIATLLKVNPRTVGTRLYRARARLHEFLRDRLGEDRHELR